LKFHPRLETVRQAYLAETTPDPRFDDSRFADFWYALPTQERVSWGWATPILSAVFNPIAEADAAREAKSPSILGFCCSANAKTELP
jgi:hypothetical protein